MSTFIIRSAPGAMGQRGGRADGVIGVAAVLVLVSLAAMAGAQEKTRPEEALQAPPPATPAEELVLPPLLVTAPPPVASSSEQLIPGKDFEVRPQGRPADVLRLIPGLIIAQHQGGGKAEQYLIRGFDADHGTDLALFIDGLPVNLRSHAHGPFDHPSRYDRLSVFAKASATLAEGMKLSLWASFYQANWRGSGQIPARAVREGLIDRFGAIDPSEGGQFTTRDNLNVEYLWKLTDNQRVTAHAYATYYELSLFNDFTFLLNHRDPLVGDEINQRDRRVLAGFDTQYEIKARPFGVGVTATVGFQYRVDTPNVVLASATERHQTGVSQDVDVVEQSSSPFVKVDIVPIDKV